jgi:RimJ/RimL family protein N-acetyltransferase
MNIAVARGEKKAVDRSPVTLRDGATARLRRLSESDFDAVLALVDCLSEEEQYFRFFTAHPRHVIAWAASQTKPVDGMVALGVFDHDELVGVANYVLTKQRGEAEIAVLVAHDQHDRGVGTVLLSELTRLARAAGLRHLVGEVLAENQGMRRVLLDSHLPVSLHRDGSVLNIDVDLGAPPQL